MFFPKYVRKGKINIPLLYFHRYVRLTPALAANILFYATLWKHLVVGPISNQFRWDDMCDSYWWSALLYIQNYVNPASIVSYTTRKYIYNAKIDRFQFQCFGHSWYLSVDMQCFILSPLFIYPLWRWRNKFVWVMPLTICLSVGCVFSLFITNGFISNVDILLGEPEYGDNPNLIDYIINAYPILVRQIYIENK